MNKQHFYRFHQQKSLKKQDATELKTYRKQRIIVIRPRIRRTVPV